MLNREEAKAAPHGDTPQLVVHPAAWDWIVDAIYDRGLVIGHVPQERETDLPTFVITVETL